MNDNEKRIFKKALALQEQLSGNAPKLRDDFQQRVMARIGDERKRREQFSDMASIAAVLLSVAVFGILFLVIDYLGWVDLRSIWLSIRNALSFGDFSTCFRIAAPDPEMLHLIIMTSSVLLFYGLIYLLIDRRMRRKAQ